MNLTRNTISILLSSLFLASCGGGSTTIDISEDNFTDQPKIYGIKGKGIELFQKPSTDAEKVKNEKASSITQTLVFATVDQTVKIRVIEENGEWSRIQVVEPAYLSESHQGWIKSSFILKHEAETKKAIEMFNKPKELQAQLSKNGIGQLRDWHSDGVGWIASTAYFSFGTASKENGMQNNLAYYIESPSSNYVEQLKIILNINNSAENKAALEALAALVQKTFQSLKLKTPKKLTNSIQLGQAIESEYESCKVILTKEDSKIESWKLIISSK